MKNLMIILGLMLPVSAAAVELEEVAPDFTLKGFDGQNLRLEEFRGQVVLINFWASWCGPCRQEMPLLDRLHDRYDDLGFSVLGVNVDKNEAKVRKLLGRIGVNFPLLRDQGQQVSEAYGVDAMPYTVVVDRNGVISYIHRGYKPGDEAHYTEQVRRLLRTPVSFLDGKQQSRHVQTVDTGLNTSAVNLRAGQNSEQASPVNGEAASS